MSTTVDTYIVQETNKTLGEILESLDKIKEEVEKIHPEVIAASPSRIGKDGVDLLVKAHEALKQINEGLNGYRLGTLLLSLLSKEGD